MKREIKFRGKAKDDGTWVHGDLTTGNTIHTSASWYEDGEGEWWGHECHEETIGQYTGLKDKNGVEIYEGDIISFKWFSYGEYELEHEYKGTVEFWNGSNMFCCEHGNYPFSELDFDSESDIEIIGNIFDNPELLKDK